MGVEHLTCGVNKTIKDGDIAPWKDLNKDNRKEQRNSYILVWGRLSSVSIFLRQPSRLWAWRSGRAYVQGAPKKMSHSDF